MSKTVLVLGASGRFGRHASAAFAEAGWQVRRFDRRRDDLGEAARGADVIVNGWNPPYPDWAKMVPRLHADVRAVAKRTGATVILPGNVYVFGPRTPPPWSTDSAHAATNPLGRIRIDMEAAYAREGVRTIVLRAGDFLDTEASGNWFDKVMAARIGDGVLTYPGPADIPHAWAFLPDLARCAVALADRRTDLPPFADIPFPGLTMSGQEMAAHLSDVTGRPVRIKPMAWWMLKLAGPVWPMGRCLLEMRYLWDTPHRLDPAPLEAVLPGFAMTPPREALARSIRPLIATRGAGRPAAAG